MVLVEIAVKGEGDFIISQFGSLSTSFSQFWHAQLPVARLPFATAMSSLISPLGIMYTKILNWFIADINDDLCWE